MNRSNTVRNLALGALAVSALGLAVTPAVAAPEAYAIDPAHSAVAFSIRHLFSRVPGRFTKFEGKIVVDRDDWTKSTVQVTIDAASIDTNEPARDKHLRSDAFFDVAKQPKLTFVSTRVKQVAANKLQVEGNLTIRGTTKPVVLDAEVLGFGPAYGGGFRGGRRSGVARAGDRRTAGRSRPWRAATGSPRNRRRYRPRSRETRG